MGHLSDSEVTRPHDPQDGCVCTSGVTSNNGVYTYWRHRSANARLVEGIKFFCPGDRFVNVGFHGGHEGGMNGQWTVLGMRRLATFNGKYGRNRVLNGSGPRRVFAAGGDLKSYMPLCPCNWRQQGYKSSEWYWHIND